MFPFHRDTEACGWLNPGLGILCKVVKSRDNIESCDKSCGSSKMQSWFTASVRFWRLNAPTRYKKPSKNMFILKRYYQYFVKGKVAIHVRKTCIIKTIQNLKACSHRQSLYPPQQLQHKLLELLNPEKVKPTQQLFIYSSISCQLEAQTLTLY